MRVLVTGGSGQLGQALRDAAPSGIDCSFPTRIQLDLADTDSMVDSVESFQPDLIVNAAAYTKVDLAENELDEAISANHKGVLVLAQLAAKQRARVIHISTDFVFDGTRNRAYKPDDKTNPISAYGRSKRDGELAVQELIPEDSLIVRTAWLYGPVGINFLSTMLRLMATEKTVRVVDDQIGCPTSTAGLAQAIWAWARMPEATGTRHWADCGVASWYDFAVAIAEEAKALGVLTKSATVVPISTRDFPTAATRPKMSVLNSNSSRRELNMDPLHWRQALRAVLQAKIIDG